MNLKTLKAKADSRAGVTLVELLVVILIVTILSVSLLPLLKPFITDAQYAAEPIPVIGNLRTMVGLYYYEKNYLPGLPLTTSGAVDTTLAATADNPGGISVITNGATALQSFVGVTESELVSYYPSVYTTPLNVTTIALLGAGGTTPPGSLVNHFSNHINVNYEDLTGKRVKPKHFQYRVMGGAYQNGAYAYVIGVFGDSDGLPSGTGYAVIEIVNPTANAKFVGTWKRNKTVSGTAGQVVIMDGAESGIAANDATDAKTANVCWIGVPQSTYLSTDASTAKQDVADGIAQLKLAGWEF